MITSPPPQKRKSFSYVDIRKLAELFSISPSAVDLEKAECAHFAANLYFPVKLQTGDVVEECLSGMKTAFIEFNLVFTYVVDEFGNKEVLKPPVEV